MSDLYNNSKQSKILKKLLADAANIDADFANFKKGYYRLTQSDHATKALILQCHLIIEYYMTKYLEAANPASPKIGEVGLSFREKAELANHPQANFQFLYTGIIALNKIRNKIAHRLDYTPQKADFASLLNGIEIWHKAAKKSIPQGIDVVPVFTELVCAFFHGDTQGILRHGDGCGLPGLIKYWQREN